MMSLLESVFGYVNGKLFAPSGVPSWLRAGWSTSSVQSLLSGGNCPVFPPSGCGSGYPSIISKCFPRISVVFPYIFSCLVLYCLFK